MSQITRRPLSKISAKHYGELIFRSLLFLAALGIYLTGRLNTSLLTGWGSLSPLLLVVWVVFLVEMALRFFPSSLESAGCQKQFAKAFQPRTQEGELRGWHTAGRAVAAVAPVWLALNAVFGGLYFAGVIDAGVLLLLCLAYSVCDMICILFFCPFQTWFMKNKCCVTCRIYNWDYAMMCTPLVFIPSWYTWSMLAMALALLVRWEWAAHRHPDWFSDQTNASLTCAQCTEKLCHHKKQLRRFWKDLQHREA